MGGNWAWDRAWPLTCVCSSDWCGTWPEDACGDCQSGADQHDVIPCVKKR